MESYRRLDAAFNGAGIDGIAVPTADCTVENWQRMIACDLTGVWYCMRHEIPQMLKNGGGVIVNCVRRGIRVNAVCPGLIDTPMWRSIPPEMAKTLVEASPAGRFGLPHRLSWQIAVSDALDGLVVRMPAKQV